MPIALRRLRPLLLGLAALAAALAPARVADAADETDGTIETRARLEPSDLGPGGKGFLIVESHVAHALHVYAQGESRLEWEPIPVEGVSYDAADGRVHWERHAATPGAVEWTKPTPYQDPNFPEMEPFPVWKEGHDFTLKIPVTIGASVPPGTEIGVVLDYSACDELMCYERVRGQRAAAQLAAAAGGGAASSAAGAPKVSAPAGDEAVEIRLEVVDDKAVVTFVVRDRYHLYMPGNEEGWPLEVEPLPDEGITWGPVSYEDEGGLVEAQPFHAEAAFQRAPEAPRLRVRVAWQACNDVGRCLPPDEAVLEASWTGDVGAKALPPPPPMVPPGTEEPPAPAPGPAVDIADGEKVLETQPRDALFPVVHGDDLSAPRQDGDWRVVGQVKAEESWFAKSWRNSWVLALLGVFVFGVGLAFTPCVLPIIPLTISVIGGGAAGKASRGRLTWMLTIYVLGLSSTYGLAGAVSGMLGEAIDIEAAFRIPAVVWAIAIFFLLLAAGMLGIFELQPPQWMERVRGGAAQKSGTLLGAFLLGCVAALVASPCTGPFVVAMLTFVATMGDPFVGFLLFFTLGLGMGAVFFAAGSLNMLARPGPWMIWVRYAFGVILVGVSLYFLASAGLLARIPLFAVGFAIALITWLMVARHLVRKEGENPVVARNRGAILAVALAIVTGLVARFGTEPTHAAVSQTAADAEEDWIHLRDVEHLKAEVERAQQEGRPVVVDVWATWCFYCKKFDEVIEDDPYLRDAAARLVRLKVDESSAPRPDLRKAVGLPEKGQPRMAFLDEQGRIRRALEIERWFGKAGEDPAWELKRRLDFLLRRTDATESAQR